MDNHVKCMCEECKYNEQYECHAKNIEVKSNGDNRVESSAGTCCDTFVSKNDVSLLNKGYV